MTTSPSTGPTSAQQGKGVTPDTAAEPTTYDAKLARGRAASRGPEPSPTPAPAVEPARAATSSDPGDGGLRTSFAPTLLIALAALAAIAPLAMDAYLPAFNQMAADLGISASTTQLTLTAFLVGVALGQLSIGVLSDRFGRRPLLLWGSVLAFVAGVGTALAPSAAVLLAARFLQGLGGAAGMVLGRAVISDRSRGITAAQALSLVMAIQGIAPVIAPILGGALVGPVGWRGILGVVAAFQGILVLLVAAWVPETLPAEQRHEGGFGVLAQGARELGKDHVFVRLIIINALVYALLTSYLSAAPFMLQGVLGMSTAAYTAVFAVCGLVVTITVAVCGSAAKRVSPERQIRLGLLAILVVDVVFAGVCFIWLSGPVASTPLTIATVALFIIHVMMLGTCMGNLPAVSLGRTGRWAGTGSALLGFIQFVCGGLASPLVGLSGQTSGVAFGVVIVVLAVTANVLAAFGVRDRGEKERLRAEAKAKRAARLGRDQLPVPAVRNSADVELAATGAAEAAAGRAEETDRA
ncbi:multidrug effflux MFS transporter [Actinomyces sp. MRS3W]|uniref:multidrug effflux MFS transporter n=1 Tax=Actinomyces sp. MRS3W TaxID=2800796 RepID=UPI0028FD6271|nr:multidrug effflux MFS transporter [Actinomyces sp. MRS3W]MDU0347406.1 multidrug effflux MFS transporter [Actinomyces sp. MRS3W]